MFLRAKLIQLLCRWESKEQEDNPIIVSELNHPRPSIRLRGKCHNSSVLIGNANIYHQSSACSCV